MKAVAINGSPRKNWNTAMLLKNALEGAEAQGAKTKLINLYDLDYKGCISCFACKVDGGKSYGKCAVNDDLKSVLRKIEKADVLILGSPVYLGEVTGEMRSFMERLIFQYYTYTDPAGTLFGREIKTGFIYTMGATEEMMKQRGYQYFMDMDSMFLKTIFGHSESLSCNDTLQFKNYSKYVVPRFDPESKAKRREEVFPLDCRKAFEMGQKLAKEEAK
jgi:multimeric flavodoxin WrbA